MTPYKVHIMSGKPTLTPLDEIIGSNVRRIRKELDASQEDFAEIMGCESAMVSMLERGQRAWTTKYIYALSQHYNIPVAGFFGAVEMTPEDKKIFDGMKELLTLKSEPSVKAKKDGKP